VQRSCILAVPMPALSLPRLGRLALDLLYPPACALCGRGGPLVCDSCWASLPRADGRRCQICWLPITDSNCRNCAVHPLSLGALRSAFQYQGPARLLVQRFKFGNLSSLSEIMAPAMADLVDWPNDAVVPVPLSGARERQRGYNQSRLLAKAVATALDVPVVEVLKRPRSGPPQVKAATREERRRNVENVFAVRDLRQVAGLSLVLVDDVATTGATLDACSRVLLAAAARNVTALTFARDELTVDGISAR
jgi:ComF family protein